MQAVKLWRKRVPHHEDYRRISDVLMAGESAVRNRWAMGPARWAEWLAFMQARGLEWGRPLSETTAPALPLQPGWNVYQFPRGDNIASALSGNGKIRQRMVALCREVDCFQRLLSELTDAKKVHHTFIMLRGGLDAIWEDLDEAGILAKQ
jgi:hypothetical protein